MTGALHFEPSSFVVQSVRLGCEEILPYMYHSWHHTLLGAEAVCTVVFGSVFS